ncbi:MAG: dethiobiotin synthase [Thermodesulfobacteriota bacterium]
MPPNTKSIFITGTDTGVGKTVIMAALAWTMSSAGKRAAVMKPIQTGARGSGLMDIEFVEKVLGANYDLDEVCPYRFPEPLSPLTASMISGNEIDIEKIKNAYLRLELANELVIVEGAGGLLVPIREDYLMSDLALELGLSLLIVTRPGLGALNHTALTVESAKSRGLDILGVVINRFPSNPGRAERTNPAQIVRMTGVPLAGMFPSDPSLSVEEGRIGKIREIASGAFVPSLYGTFDYANFITSLAKFDGSL